MLLLDAAVVWHPRLYGLGMFATGATVGPGAVLVATVWAVFTMASDEGRFSDVLSICVFIQLSIHFRGH